MPFHAKVYRALVSCPSDVHKARATAIQAINEWNYTHSTEHGLFIEPVTWETHVAPELGAPPQTIINREVVENCDFLIGIFWTRFGTSTENFGSGTEEEISQFLASQRQVLLYFSDEEISPSQIDHKQHQRVKRFRKAKSNSGLYKTFTNLLDFKLMLKDHLSQKIRQITAGHLMADPSGLIAVMPLQNTNVTVSLLFGEHTLTILFKDGFTFFSESVNVLKQRLLHPDFSTTLLLLHPDYEYLGGVADMDPGKRGNLESQRSDCIQAIRKMHNLRMEILAETGQDIAKRVRLIGYRNVPTWNGMLGESRTIVSLYPTHAYRGNLVTLDICNTLPSGQRSLWFNWYATDVTELIRFAQAESRSWNLWDYKLPPNDP